MNIPTLLSSAFLASSILFSGAASAQPNDTIYVAPRTEWGHAELRGVWNFSSNIPLQRPQNLAGQEFYTSEQFIALERARAEAAATAGELTQTIGGVVGGYNDFWVEIMPLDVNMRTSIIIDPPDGRLPDIVPGAPRAYGGLGPDSQGERPVRFTVGGIGKDGPEDRGLSERCLLGFNSVPPFEPSLYNNNVQLFQNKDHFVIFNEMIHEARIVPMDNRPHVHEDIRLWTGNSRGYWDGDTLVVETRNFNDKTQSFAGVGISADKTLIERFTRAGPDRVDYQYTVIDPKAFVAPITGIVPMFRSDGELFEYACHEGNYGMVNILRGQRVEEGNWDHENNRSVMRAGR